MMVLKTSLAAGVALFTLQAVLAQDAPSDTQAQLKKALQQIELLAGKVEAQEARIRELEAGHGSSPPGVAVPQPAPLPPPANVEPAPAVAPPPAQEDTSRP